MSETGKVCNMHSPQEAPGISLGNVLLQKKSTILERWFNAILDTYPPDTANFLKKQKNPFANPVGSTIFQEIENIFNELLQGVDPDKVSPFLDRIVRIRAVQDFTPAQAISFIFLLKKVVRDELLPDIRENRFSEELLALEARIDNLALLSFDIYMKCREKLYEIRANQTINGTYLLLKKAKLITEAPEPGPDHKDSDIK